MCDCNRISSPQSWQEEIRRAVARKDWMTIGFEFGGANEESRLVELGKIIAELAGHIPEGVRVPWRRMYARQLKEIRAGNRAEDLKAQRLHEQKAGRLRAEGLCPCKSCGKLRARVMEGMATADDLRRLGV